MAVITIIDKSMAGQETSSYIVANPYLGITNYTQLTDTPEGFTGKANQAVTVKADESGLEFTALTDYQPQIDSKADESATSAALATKLNITDYTASDALTKIKTVDGSGSGLDADTVDGKHASEFADSVHAHAIADVTGLQASLDAKADTAYVDAQVAGVHTHAIADVTGLQTSLDAKADTSYVDTKAAIGHSHAIADVTGLQTSLDAKAEITYVDAQVAGLTSQIGVKLDASAYTAVDVLTKVKTIDGAGSGLDADTVDGIHGSAFAIKTPAVMDHGTVSTGTVTLDLSSPKHKLTVGGALTIVFSNWPASGNYGEVELELVNGGAFAVTLPTTNWIIGDGTTSTTFADTNVTLASSGSNTFMWWSDDAGAAVSGVAG